MLNVCSTGMLRYIIVACYGENDATCRVQHRNATHIRCRRILSARRSDSTEANSCDARCLLANVNWRCYSRLLNQYPALRVIWSDTRGCCAVVLLITAVNADACCVYSSVPIIKYKLRVQQMHSPLSNAGGYHIAETDCR